MGLASLPSLGLPRERASRIGSLTPPTSTPSGINREQPGWHGRGAASPLGWMERGRARALAFPPSRLTAFPASRNAVASTGPQTFHRYSD